MNILYITNGISGSGGLEKVLSIKTAYFCEEYGYEIHIITLNENGKENFHKFSPHIKIHNISIDKGGLYIYSYIKEINKIIKKIAPDIVSICDDGIKAFLIPLFIKKNKFAIIYERHASLAFNDSYIEKRLIKFSQYLYDRVVVLTKGNSEEWNNYNTTIIPNPLATIPNNSLQLRSSTIICVGSISYNKGYDLLIKAWSMIAYKYPNWSIHVYGNGNSDTYKELLKELNVEKSIFFHPATNKIENVYLEASFLVLPSRSEGFGMVLIEAMSYGVPCIAFDCPSGPKDIISNNIDGILVETGNISKLKNAIERYINEPETRNKFGQQGKSKAENYHIKNIACKWKSLFENIK